MVEKNPAVSKLKTCLLGIVKKSTQIRKRGYVKGSLWQGERDGCGGENTLVLQASNENQVSARKQFQFTIPVPREKGILSIGRGTSAAMAICDLKSCTESVSITERTQYWAWKMTPKQGLGSQAFLWPQSLSFLSDVSRRCHLFICGKAKLNCPPYWPIRTKCLLSTFGLHFFLQGPKLWALLSWAIIQSLWG